MVRVRGALSRMGLHDVRTFLQSGNVLFGAEEHDRPSLEARLEDRVAEELGVRTDFILRTAHEREAVVSRKKAKIST